MANPNELKKIILSMSFDDITKSFFEDNFCHFRDDKTGKVNPPKYNMTDKVDLAPNEYHNPTKVTTTLGRLVANKFLFEDGLFKVIGYFNKPISSGNLKQIEEQLANAVLDGTIDTDTLSRYYNRIQWLGLALHSSVCGSFSEKTIGPLPEVQKLKEALFKKYEKDLQGPNGIIYANKIEELLLEEAKRVLKDDPGMDLYNSGARGSFGNNYKNMMVIRGPVWNSVTSRFDVIKSCLSEGIRKEDIPSYGSQVISGAYPKAIGTATAGYYTKKFFAVYQSTVLGPRNSDCGSKKFRELLLTEKNFKRVKYRWINDNGKLICLTPEVAKKYYGKIIKLRSPLYCTSRNLCAKCAGDLPYRLGIKNIGLTVPDISSAFLNKLMKNFHSSVISVYEIKIDKMLK